MMEYTINSHKYDIYFDKKTHLHLFSPTPNDEDLGILNLLFNDMDEYVYEKMEYNRLLPKPKKPSKFKRIVDIGAVISVFLAISLDFMLISYLIPEIIDQGFGYEIMQSAIAYTSSLTDEEYLSKINSAINGNNNLDEREKTLYAENTFIYLDNKDYIDINHLEKTLSEIDIIYAENS